MKTGSSFRDPDASVTIDQDRVIRTVRHESAEDFSRLLDDPFIQSLLASGKLIGTRPAESRAGDAETAAPGDVRYEHDLVPFVAYPVEWSPAMLARAAEFTLTLCLELLPHNYLLKDATPSNVLFSSTTPMLIDVPSIVRRQEGAYVWTALDQFERTFLLPLIANVEANIPIAWSLQDPVRGIDHEALESMLGLRKWIKPSVFRSVTMPAILTRRKSDAPPAEPRPMKNDQQARYVLERTLKANLKKVRKLASAISVRSASMWQEYTQTRDHYAGSDIDEKHQFVDSVLELVKPSWTLDVGANTGEFSRMSAAAGRVVAIDSDEAAVNRIFIESERDQSGVLAMVGDISRPTPGFGWRNEETASLIDRATSRFDLVLYLAVIHHLRATAGIPIDRILDLARELTRAYILIEHVPLSDRMFQRLSRGRDALFGDVEKPAFEAALEERFTIKQTQQLANGRTLYLALRR